MALPKLNAAPKFELAVPSTGKKVRYRPFLVKEEKNLMIAAESGDNTSVFRTLIDTISSCVEDDINQNKLTTFDIEYMFLKMRAKSVGETSRVGVKCTECETSNEQEIRIDQLEIDMPDIETKVELTDSITVELQWPAFTDLISMGMVEGKDASTEQAFTMIRSCLKTIITDEERINLSDVPESEIQDFIESMSSAQFEKIKKFIDSVPKLEHEVNFTCKNCGHDNKVLIEGVASFL